MRSFPGIFLKVFDASKARVAQNDRHGDKLVFSLHHADHFYLGTGSCSFSGLGETFNFFLMDFAAIWLSCCVENGPAHTA